MDFSFCVDNHFGLGRDSLYDIIDPISGQLVDLGHRVHWHDGTLRPDRINVIIEGFDDSAIEALRVLKHPGTMEPILVDGKPKGAKGAGIPVVIVMTERPGRPGFNDSKTAELVMRQRNFPAAAREAMAVWCLVPGVSKWARQWCQTSADLELGWSHARTGYLLERFGRDENAFYDFAFYGSLTERRRNLIKQIERRGYLVMTSERNFLSFRDGIGVATLEDKKAMDNARNRSGFLTLDNRNHMIGSAKVVLGIHQYPGWRLVSNSRFATALSLGRPVINEPPPRDVETPWRKVGVFSKSVGSFVDEAIETLAHWKEIRDAQVATVKDMFSPERCIGEALKATLGHLIKEAA